MAKIKKEAMSALKTLADLLKVDLNDSRIAIAATQCATARMYDGSLEAEVIPASSGIVRVMSPRSSGVYIKLVDHQKDSQAPAEAVYEISAFVPRVNDGGISMSEMLNGDLYCVYIGRDGIILNDAALERAADLFKKKK